MAALAESDKVRELPSTVDGVIADVQRLEREAADAAKRFELAQQGATTAQRERMLRAVDLHIGHMERISANCMEDV